MGKKIGLLILICCLNSILLLQAQDVTKADQPVFKAGERLSYRMKYGIFTAAEANLRVEESPTKFNGEPTYHIIAEGKTAGTFDVFYKVRNKYESYVDKNTLLPYFYTENRHESNYRHSDNVTFDHTSNKIKADKGTFAYTGKVFDFVSAYYFARTVNISKIKAGDKFDLQYFLEDGIHTLNITFAGREKATCSMGTFNCLKFNPTIIPGRIFKKNSKLYLWITDDNNRIPVKANVEVILGSLTMDLTNAQGLLYPLKTLHK